MFQEKVIGIIVNSLKEHYQFFDYSLIYFKINLAKNFTEGGVFNVNTNEPDNSFLISYKDTLDIIKAYNDALKTDERFNIIEIHFSKDMVPDAKFSWDQAYYDVDVEGNKKLKKKK